MDTPVIRYPFDETGVNPNNLVVGEPVTTLARKIRAVAPEYGPFYTESLVITDTATNLPLTADQYYCAELEVTASSQTGLEVMRIIMITDQTVSNNLLLQYQVVGGEYSASASAIIDQIYNLNLDDRPATWPSIIGKPSAFAPSAHLHDAGDLYGFEYVTAALDRISSAILLGDEASHDAIYSYIDLATDQINAGVAELQAQLQAHIADQTNPHKTTAAQVGAYTKAQSDANLTAVQTTLQTNINTVNTALQAHEADTNNPHGTTAAQVGAYTKAQSDANLTAMQTTLQGNINTVNSALVAHENNPNNPHGTTAAQVGAYTKAQSDANLAAGLNTVRLAFTPVQQGGGANQATNKVYLGWDGARLRAQVDNTDLGGLIASAELSANVTNLANAINTKAPADPGLGGYVYVNGNQAISVQDVHSSGTIFCANDIWAFYSDERLKENITSIKGALAKLHQITGVTYNHNALAKSLANADTSKRFMGFLAGQIQKVAPEIVGLATFDRDENGLSKSGENYLTLQYEKMTALIAEAVKEVDLKVDGIIRGLKRAGIHMPVEDVAYTDVAQAELMLA